MNTTSWLSCWQLGLIGLLTSVGINAFACKTLAQTTPSNIQPDATLGAESSRILQNQNFRGLLIEEIRGGAIRGINLFHSFREFNVSEGRGAYFFSPGADIQNILARVTGANPSEILGVLGTFGNSPPNLFLINPNGIIFGKNASLNVQGSFIGTTANGVKFGNQGEFSATNPEPVPLLTINPSALFFNRINQSAAIQNNSVAPAGIDSSGFSRFGLRVPDGKNLLLVGGNVNMDGGRLNALGGRVELGGLTEPGNVNLFFSGENLTLKFPDNVTHADVSLINQAAIYVAGSSGGNITVNARNLEIFGGSILSAGIGIGLGTPEAVAGDITLNGNGEIKVAGFESGIVNLVRLGSKGNGGDITIDAGSFSLRDGAQLLASTYGQGNAGNVTVSAKNAVSLAGGQTTIFSTVEAGGVGKGGNIDINAASLSLTDGAQLFTGTRRASETQPAARGDAGNVNVKVSGTIDIAGVKNSFPSGIRSQVGTGTVGNGGNITVDAGDFFLRDGAQLSAATFGQGNPGNVTISAKNAVSLANNAGIFSTVSAGGVGKGGDININAASLSFTDGAQLLTITREAFDSQPAGRGNAGNINVKVSGTIDIAGLKNSFPSAIFSLVQTGTVGNGGNITIDAGDFFLRDGAQLSAATFGQGNAGNVTVSAKNAVSLANNAIIFSTVEAGGVGKGGNIDISAATLSLKDGAQLQTLTRGASATQPAGRGDAGNVNVKITGAINIAGVKKGFPSQIGSAVDTGTVGNGGNITIDAGSFSLKDAARLVASTFGQGNAGTIKVNAAEFFTISGNNSGFNSGLYVDSASATGTAGDIIVNSPKVTLDNQGTLNAESASGNGGNININSDLLLMRHGSQISTTAGTAEAGGDGGNININSKFIIAVPEENSDITANAFTGKGGNINITSQGIFGIEPRPQLTDKSDITASSNFGLSGNIQILSPDNSGLQNALIQISPNAIDTNVLIAGSCIARGDKKQQNSFYITGSGALRYTPGAISPSNYSTGEVRNVSGENRRPWKKGDPIIEATGVYFLDNGQILLSRECE